MSHHNIVPHVVCFSVRRFSKTEDTSSFSQKRCIAWFREYTSPDDPDVLGELMHDT
jgi:DCN1-like protein 4/5